MGVHRSFSFTILVGLVCLQVSSGFVPSIVAHARSSMARRECSRSVTKLNGVPSGIEEIETQVVESLAQALKSGSKKLRIDCLPPGLNPQLENSAPYSVIILQSILNSMLPALAETGSVKILFSSEGDAASTENLFKGMGWSKPENVMFKGLSPRSVTSDDNAVVIVNPRNSVGDPVVLEVEKVLEIAKDATVVLLNPDLEEKVAKGIIEKDRRANMLSSFQQCYYFRNIFYMARPDLIPIERGALLHRWGAGWQVHVADTTNGNLAPGSLNRFMKMQVYRRSSKDPTAADPPKLYLALSSEEQPGREEIARCVEQADRITNRKKAEEALAALDAVETYQQAIDVISTAAVSSSSIPIGKLSNAIKLLEKEDRKGAKERKKLLEDTTQRLPCLENLTQPKSLWRLTFTFKEAKDKTGSPKVTFLPDIPLAAGQTFDADYNITNGIFAFGMPLIKFFGNFDWNEASRRLTFGFDKCQVFGFPFAIPQSDTKSKSKPGFTMFCVTPGWVLGRGNTGGIALWRRVDGV